MIFPDCTIDEEARLKVLKKYKILDTLPESQFDSIAKAAAIICGTPIALISLIDAKRNWVKAKVGTDLKEFPRAISFCGHVILQNNFFLVKDSLKDERFKDNPLVIGDTNIRFYAGFPLVTSSGHNLGALCVIGHTPSDLSEEQVFLLKTLTDQVINEIELRQSVQFLNKTGDATKVLHVEDKKERVANKNRATQDRFSYDKVINPTAVGTEKELKISFKDHFVFHRPKHLEGGDFYYHKNFFNKTFIAIGESAGNDSSAAILSFLGKSIFDNCIVDKAIINPSEILADLYSSILKILNQQEPYTRNGMDILICMIDRENNTLQYASAKGSMLIGCENEAVEILSDIKGVGGADNNDAALTNFSLHTLPFNPNITYYLYSDGYVDQFNESSQSFLKKRFKNLIVEINSLPFSEQRQKIEHCFNVWKGRKQQMDDLCVLAFKV